MLNFRDVVTDILFEEDPQNNNPGTVPPPPTAVDNTPVVKPAWFQEILNKHKELFDTDIPDDKTLRTIYAIAIKRPSKNDILQVIKYVRILDILATLYTTLSSRPKDLKTFLEQAKDSELGVQISNELKRLNPDQKDSWEITNGLVRNAYNLAREDADKAAAVALGTYNNQSVLEATKQMVAKRTNIWDRILSVKSPTQPFTNLITDIFRYPEEYMAGRKKVTGDFFEIVDNLYVQSLFRVGLAAKEFYGAELARLELEGSQTNAEPVNANYNLFNTYYNTVVLNELGVLPTIARGVGRGAKLLRQGERLARDPEYRRRYNDLKKRAKQNQRAYDDFLKGGNITNSEGKTLGPYTIKYISQIDTTEAQNLINALKGIAEYVRKGIGAGQAIKTASSLGVGMGAVG